MQKILFIDRDGTLISEAADEQIDSFNKVSFYPGALTAMARIAREMDFKLVLVTNQDGLGTAGFQEESFWPVHHLIMNTFKGEGVHFDEEIIDRTFAKDNAPTRKPGTVLLQHYIDKGFDMENSYVIGDRLNDVVLAKNLGIKGIWLRNNDALGAGEGLASPETLMPSIALQTSDWNEIYQFLKTGSRRASVTRATKETRIAIELNLNGTGNC
ncbi:MAG: histidinol-phosphatase, partial [Sphingobacteriales bacterium]